MSGSAFLSADPRQPERMAQFSRAIAGWCNAEGLLPSPACHKLGVGRQFLGDAIGGRMDPLEVAPSTAMRILQVTGLTAAYLGFEVEERQPGTPGGSGSASEGIKPPLADARAPAVASIQTVDAPAANPHAVAGASYVFRREGSAIGAWYEAPGTIVLHLSATDTRLGELSARLTPDDCDHAIAALTQARNAARRAMARSDFYREA